MKVMGLIGGMSWESSSDYYQIINRLVKNKLGESHSCKCIMYSVDFDEIERLQHKGEWDVLSAMMINIAKSLEIAGAEFIVICTNTMHIMADEIKESINIPLLHIADAAAEQIRLKKIKRVGLLGTKFTMGQGFYVQRIKDHYGIEVIVPEVDDQNMIHNIIYSELVRGIIKPGSKSKYIEIINKLADNGAEGIILGCTEIPMLIKQEDVSIPVFDTTKIHAEYAVDFALK